MGSEALLRLACERAFAVARVGYEADPSIDPPEAMRSFLYVGRLPRRAITVAQRALESDDVFRARVAADSTVEEVGEAGHLWLHRPEGWSESFERLKKDAESSEVKQAVGASGAVARRQTPTIPPPPGFEPSDFSENGNTTNGDGEATPNGDAENIEDDMGDVNAIEHELSSLRGLVDRLASERKGVTVSGDDDTTDVSMQLSPNKGEAQVESGAVNKLRSDLEQAFKDRDEARRKHSDSLTHQLELEKQLSKFRNDQSEIDAAKAESDGRVVEARKELARVTANREEAERQREATIEQMTGLNGEINRLKGELKTAAVARSQFEAQISDLRAKAKGSQAEIEQAATRAQRLVATNEGLSRRIVEGEQEIERLRVELDGFADLARRADTLQAETEDLSEQLKNVKAEKYELQELLEARKNEMATLNGATNDLRTDRDQLADQVASLQNSLGEALTDLGEVRIGRDSDREKTQAFRSESDDLKVELARLQEIDSKQSAKLDELLGEQSAHESQKQRNEELEERVASLDAQLNKLRGDLTQAASERDEAIQKISERAGEFESLQNQTQTFRTESETSNAALKRVESSLEEIRVERETLATQLSAAEQQTKTAEDQASKSQQQLEEALSNLGAIQLEISNRQSEIESVKSSLAEESSRAKEYKVRADTRKQALDDYEAKSKIAADEITALTAALAQQKEETKTLDASARGAKKDVEEMRSELEAVRNELKAATSDAASARSDLNAAKDEHAADADVEESDDNIGSPALLKKTSSTQADDSSATVLSAEREEASADVSTDDQDIDIDSSDDDLQLGETTEKTPTGLADNAADASGEKKTSSEISDGSGVASLIRSVPDGDDSSETTDSVAAVPDTSSRRPPSMLEDEEAPAPNGGSGDDDLDSLSNIISEKVTSFNSDSSEDKDASETERDDVTFFGDRTASVGSSDEPDIGRPPSVFSTGEVSAIDDDEDSDDTFQPPADIPISAVSPLKSPADDSESTSLATSGRRAVEIPDDVASSGGVELARFVVESPEIVLLVDGDGVAKMGWSSRSVAEQREALVSWLADLTASTGASSDVVFDGRTGDDGSLPSSRVVSIRLSTPPTEPVAALDELVDAYPPQFPIAVVTDNTTLQDSAKERGAVALSNAQLLDLFTPE